MANNFLFNTVLAYRSVRTNKLRTGITVGIIALGIMALIGILTAIEGLKASIYSSFSGMGANTFQITNEVLKKKRGGGGINISSVDQRNISYRDAQDFKKRFSFPGTEVGLSIMGTGIATVRYASEKTNPNIHVMGVDERYVTISSTTLAAGRNFSTTEVENGSYVCLLGNSIATKLFKGKLQNALNAVISVGYIKYRVIGVAESKGSSMVSNLDNNVFVPLQNARAVYGGDNSFVVSVKVGNVALIDIAAEEAEGLFRIVRRVPLNAPSNFGVNKNDNLAAMVMENVTYVTGAALFIGLITLLGAAIGLMNIMLVSVAERTREIGVSKALGARSSSIRRQFLTESIMISLAGGVIGVITGILIGNIVSLLLKTGFIVPWMWISIGIVSCTIVGLASGLYPAARAARLDPIEALRYE
ncbi:ABC transporter permease [Taibaiella koreensis]|uniref:ABC transporter permease n=1 Tax=Taibaiella koreensis TaxID=1268548 RepID=UPI000E59C2D7|nr:ABC transporter permease [Taibaiella koreensis]